MFASEPLVQLFYNQGRAASSDPDVERRKDKVFSAEADSEDHPSNCAATPRIPGSKQLDRSVKIHIHKTSGHVPPQISRAPERQRRAALQWNLSPYKRKDCLHGPNIVVKTSFDSIGTTYNASRGVLGFAKIKHLSTAILAILYTLAPSTDCPSHDMCFPTSQEVLDGGIQILVWAQQSGRRPQRH